MHAHKCQLKHGGEHTTGVGRAFGEESELYWSKLKGLQGSLERSGSTKWHDRLGEVINQVNADSISRVPALLFEQVGALWRNSMTTPMRVPRVPHDFSHDDLMIFLMTNSCFFSWPSHGFSHGHLMIFLMINS